MARRADVLRALAEQEESRARAAIRAGDTEAAERALQRARTLRRIAYMRAAAAAYQDDPSLNPAEPVIDDTDEEVQPAQLASDIDTRQERLDAL